MCRAEWSAGWISADTALPTPAWAGAFVQGTAWITLPDSLRALVSQSLVKDKLECPPWHFSAAKFGGEK